MCIYACQQIFFLCLIIVRSKSQKVFTISTRNVKVCRICFCRGVKCKRMIISPLLTFSYCPLQTHSAEKVLVKFISAATAVMK